MKAGDVSQAPTDANSHHFQGSQQVSSSVGIRKAENYGRHPAEKVAEGLNRSQASSIRNSTRNISDRQQDLPAHRSRRRRSHHI